MKYMGNLIVVKDMEQSKRFYHTLFDLKIISDFGANITFEGGLSLQTLDTWTDFTGKPESDIMFRNNAAELYFEAGDFDTFMETLRQSEAIDYVHPVKEHSWGQRAVRFYDPDGHIVEVGENITFVVKRFIDGGLSEEETAVRIDVPLDYIRSVLK